MSVEHFGLLNEYFYGIEYLKKRKQQLIIFINNYRLFSIELKILFVLLSSTAFSAK